MFTAYVTTVNKKYNYVIFEYEGEIYCKKIIFIDINTCHKSSIIINILKNNK